MAGERTRQGLGEAEKDREAERQRDIFVVLEKDEILSLKFYSRACRAVTGVAVS